MSSQTEGSAAPSRFGRWRLQRARDRYNDAEHYLSKWGFGMTPSERRKECERVNRLRAKVKRMEQRWGMADAD